MKFATKSIHSGYDHHQHNRALMPPVYQTSAFAHDHPQHELAHRQKLLNLIAGLRPVNAV